MNKEGRTPNLVELMNKPLGYHLEKGHNMANRDDYDFQDGPLNSGETIDVGNTPVDKKDIRKNKFLVTRYIEGYK